ncbi:MAG: hypothetical protein N3H30_03155, partial [Candidatus Micrarchaeota archaeon]|nr:hypothetical protein [Candidatus Micrarchaeota archaeon]
MLYLTSQHDGRVLKYVITELEKKAKLLEKGPNTQSYEKGVRYASCLVTALNTFKNEDFSGIHALEMFCTALGEYSRGDLYNEATRLFFELFERYSKTFRAEALTPHTY